MDWISSWVQVQVVLPAPEGGVGFGDVTGLGGPGGRVEPSGCLRIRASRTFPRLAITSGLVSSRRLAASRFSWSAVIKGPNRWMLRTSLGGGLASQRGVLGGIEHQVGQAALGVGIGHLAEGLGDGRARVGCRPAPRPARARRRSGRPPVGLCASVAIRARSSAASRA